MLKILRVWGKGEKGMLYEMQILVVFSHQFWLLFGLSFKSLRNYVRRVLVTQSQQTRSGSSQKWCQRGNKFISDLRIDLL